MRIAGDNIKIRENHLTINYDDYGPIYAPVIIFIHGFPFNKNMWDLQAEVLKNNYRVISYDVRGFGESYADNYKVTVDLLTEDLIDLMDHLELKKVSLCGLSMGGIIALNAIEKYPARFNSLILSDTHCLPDSRERREEKMKIITSIREKGIRDFAERSLKHFFASTSFLRRREEVRAARKMIMSTSVKSICNTLLSLGQNRDICSRLSEITIPVLIMVGKEDRISPPRVAEFMHEHIKDSSLKVIEYAGHLPNMENTQEFNYHLKKFIDKVSRKRVLSEPVLTHK